jgi:hypothetical protein
MKTLNHFPIIAIAIIAMLVSACTNDWDDHYQQKAQTVDNESVAIVDAKIAQFLESETSLSTVFNLFQETGLLNTIDSTAQRHTILVINNTVAMPSNIDDKAYFAKTHIAPVALSPSHLRDGMRVLMLNGKYLNIKVQEVAVGEGEDGSEVGGYNISFNGIKVTRITQVNDGYIYELEDYIVAPQSLYEIIKNLDEDYSVFRQMVLGKATRTFDKAASLPIGVDVTGNTVYDSIFIETFPYFAAKEFDIMSESLTATMLIPSNEIVQHAIDTAKLYLEVTGLFRHDTIIENWVFQSAFFNKIYEKSDFESNVDLTSVFGKQWRTTVQQVDFDSRSTMSNGVYYKTKYLKIPINLLIYRLKDYMKWYEFMSAEQKADYFIETNIVFDKISTDVAAWTGLPTMLDLFPRIENRVLFYNLDSISKETGEWELEFTAIRCTDKGDGTYDIVPFGIPPGEYELCFGFKEYKGTAASPGDWDVYFNDDFITTVLKSQLTTTTFHYDRNGQGYPEGYEDLKAKWSTAEGKPANYNRDGGKVGVITIGGSGVQPVKFTFKGKNADPSVSLAFHHWCLRPTKNCY